MKTEIIIVLTVLGAIAAVLLLVIAFAYIAYRMAFFSDRKKPRDPYASLNGELSERKKKSKEYIDKLIGMPYESVSITSRDGLRLHARYYHVRDGAPLEIQMHGYKSTSVHDFGGGALECIGMGYNLLLVDQRAHGESCGHVISFGIKERMDALSWAEYAVSRFGSDVRILLYGISMGGATVLMASDLPLPENVVGIVADCPYSSPRKIIAKVAGEMGFPSWLVMPAMKLGARIFGRFDLDECTATDAVRSSRVPILIIHGEGDKFVPCDMSREIAEGVEGLTLHTFPEVGHGLSFIYDHERYMNIINEFHRKVLGDTK